MMWKDMGGDQREGILVYVQGMHRGDIFGERSGRLRQMVEYMKEKVTGLLVEDNGEETGSSVTTTGVNQDRKDQAREEVARNTRTKEMITGVEDEGEIRTEERREEGDMFWGNAYCNPLIWLKSTKSGPVA